MVAKAEEGAMGLEAEWSQRTPSLLLAQRTRGTGEGTGAPGEGEPGVSENRNG